MDLVSGKIAIITGAASGLGASYVKRLFKSGMKGCTLVDIDESRGESTSKEMNCCFGKNKSIFIQADVTEPDQFECAFKKTLQNFKQIDVLINNAGILRDKTWEEMIKLNVESTIMGSLLGIKYMGKYNGGNGGVIINSASTAALEPLASFPCYSGTKNFVIGFTRSIGTPWWLTLTGIRFLTICPAVVNTKMITQAEDWVFEGYKGLNFLAKNIRIEQTVEEVAEGLNTMINYGQTGSIWVKQADWPIYQIEIPPIHDMMPKCL